MIKTINPTALGPAKGYANGMLVADRRLLLTGGQIGWDADRVLAPEFVEQFAQALDNVLAVVNEAGGCAEDIVSMTVFVTDMAAYRVAQKSLGAVWRQRLGKHYPAMALLGVSELVEPHAKVEIQAVAAILGDGP